MMLKNIIRSATVNNHYAEPTFGNPLRKITG